MEWNNLALTYERAKAEGVIDDIELLDGPGGAGESKPVARAWTSPVSDDS